MTSFKSFTRYHLHHISLRKKMINKFYFFSHIIILHFPSKTRLQYKKNFFLILVIAICIKIFNLDNKTNFSSTILFFCKYIFTTIIFAINNFTIHKKKYLRMTFGVDPDTHIDSLEHAKQATIDGTSKWSCSITLTGTKKITKIKKYY